MAETHTSKETGKYGSKIEMQAIPEEPFLALYGPAADRLAGSHEREVKREAYRQASEMMGLGTEEYKVPVIMTGAGAAIMAHMLHGHPKEGDIITRRDRRTGLYEQEER